LPVNAVVDFESSQRPMSSVIERPQLMIEGLTGAHGLEALVSRRAGTRDHADARDDGVHSVTIWNKAQPAIP
jgi:hypothetical protein